MRSPSFFGFIPARYDSTRFPGKPLAELLGKPMFWHVWARASQCRRLVSVHLCTDDARIRDVAATFDVPCLMTRTDHPNGSSRVLEAALAQGLSDDAVVVNIQGDEPALESAMIDALIAPFADPAVAVTTLACPMDREEALLPDRVKVVCSQKGDALYFSRSPLPFERTAAPAPPHLLHVGLYAYRLRALAAYAAFPPSPLERMESLEQLRFLENGIPVRVVVTPHRSHGVDTPEDLERILPLMVRKG